MNDPQLQRTGIYFRGLQMARDHERPGTDTSLSQLLDVVERRLDSAAVTLGYGTTSQPFDYL